jgi:alkylhydroperoxidase family enzyme
VSATQAGLTEEKISKIADWKTEGVFDTRERLALQFAEKQALDHKSVDDAFIEQLRQDYTDPEILELGIMIGQYIGLGRLIRALDLESKSCGLG